MMRRGDANALCRWRGVSKLLAVTAALLGILSLGTAVWGYSSGPPDGYAGDPPQYQNCTACHNSFPVNSGDGTLSLQGLPVFYMPGDTYLLQVLLQDPGQSRWGFELTAITEDGLQAGAFQVMNNQVQISEQPGDLRDYVKHTSSGTFLGDTMAQWSFLWIAPSVDVGPVQFFAAGNAAHGNFNPTGDYIYTISDTLMEVQETPFPQIPQDLVVQVAPNPIRTLGTILLESTKNQPVKLVLFRQDGTQAAILYQGTLRPGQTTILLRPRTTLRQGVYLLTIVTPERRWSKPLILLK